MDLEIRNCKTLVRGYAGGGREAGVLRVLGVCLGRRDLRTYTEVTGLNDEREGGGCGGA
jgi:hypothetical protein